MIARAPTYDRAAIMARARGEARQARAAASPLPWKSLISAALGRAWLHAKLAASVLILTNGRSPAASKVRGVRR